MFSYLQNIWTWWRQGRWHYLCELVNHGQSWFTSSRVLLSRDWSMETGNIYIELKSNWLKHIHDYFYLRRSFSLTIPVINVWVLNGSLQTIVNTILITTYIFLWICFFNSSTTIWYCVTCITCLNHWDCLVLQYTGTSWSSSLDVTLWFHHLCINTLLAHHAKGHVNYCHLLSSVLPL